MKSHFFGKLLPQSINTFVKKAWGKKKIWKLLPPAHSGTHWKTPSRGKRSVNQRRHKTCDIKPHRKFCGWQEDANCIKMQIKWHIWGRKWARQSDPEVILMNHVVVPSHSDSEAANPAVFHHYFASRRLNAPPTSICTNCRWYMTIKAITRQVGFFSCN